MHEVKIYNYILLLLPVFQNSILRNNLCQQLLVYFDLSEGEGIELIILAYLMLDCQDIFFKLISLIANKSTYT